MMKKTLFLISLLIPLMLILPGAGYAEEPPPCATWTLVGPPVVGTIVFDLVKIEGGLYYYVADFTGCCADCFGSCKTSCNVRITKPLVPLGFPLDSASEQWLQNYNITNGGPKNCNPVVNGIEKKDLVVETILKFETKNVDKDPEDEVVADVVMYYYTCD